MNQPKKYTCLTYSDFSFLIPNEEIFTATCCSDLSFVADQKGQLTKLQFSDQQLDFIDFDDCVRLFNISVKTSEVKTSVIVKNRGLYNEGDYFALLTSADCRVISVEPECFRNPQSPYNKIFDSMGLKSLFFITKKDDLMNEKNAVNLELDVNRFLGRVYETHSCC